MQNRQIIRLATLLIGLLSPIAVQADERVLGYKVQKLDHPLIAVEGWVGKKAAYCPMLRVWKRDTVDQLPAIWYAFTAGKGRTDLSDVFENPRYDGVKTQAWHFQFDCGKRQGRVVEYRRTSDSFLRGKSVSYRNQEDLPYQGQWIEYTDKGLKKEWVLLHPEALYEKSTLEMLWRETCANVTHRPK